MQHHSPVAVSVNARDNDALKQRDKQTCLDFASVFEDCTGKDTRHERFFSLIRLFAQQSVGDTR